MLPCTGLRIKLEMSLMNIKHESIEKKRNVYKTLGGRKKKIYIRGVARTSDNITYMRAVILCNSKTAHIKAKTHTSSNTVCTLCAKHAQNSHTFTISAHLLDKIQQNTFGLWSLPLN